MINSGRNIMATMRRMAVVAAAFLGGTFVSSMLSHAHAATSESISIQLAPKDIYAPSAITDLTATPGGVGQMLLQWTAPDEDNFQYTNRDPAASYVIRIATFSVDSVGGSTATWWSLAQDVAGEPVPSSNPTQDSLLLNSLNQGVTYWASIISIDDEGQTSPIDTKSAAAGQQAHALIASGGVPGTPSNFAGASTDTATIQWTWDAEAGASFYTLYTFPGDAMVDQTTNTSLVEVGLSPNTAYTRRLRAGNGSGQGSPTVAQTVFTRAAVPTSVAASVSNFVDINVTWSANGNPAGTSYRLERSLDGTNFVILSLLTTTSYDDTGLAEDTTYYYRVRAFNGDGIITAPSAVASVQTQTQFDFLAPARPLGFKGSLDQTQTAFTLSWEAVTTNADGTPLTDLDGYNIYKRDTLKGTATKITPTPLTVTAFADQVNGQTFYYTVRAVDTSGNESIEVYLVDSSENTNVIFLGSDGASNVVVPSAVNDLLRSGFNKYGVPLIMELNEFPSPNDSTIVRNVEFKVMRSDNNEEVKDLSFEQPVAIVGVAYNQLNGQVVRGAPSANAAVDASAVTASSPNDLSLYWNNGVRWVKVGGTLDEAEQLVKTNSSFLGSFQLRIETKSTSLSLHKANVYPRVFTPNNDGFNDKVYFVLENPNGAAVQGQIFDMEGRHVATLPPSTLTAGIATTLTWDGKDMNGMVVPGGVYVYRIKGEGQTFTGTVAVAR